MLAKYLTTLLALSRFPIIGTDRHPDDDMTAVDTSILAIETVQSMEPMGLVFLIYPITHFY